MEGRADSQVLGASVSAYLHSVEAELATIPRSDRRDARAAVEDHLRESIAKGASASEAIRDTGSPRTVAGPYLQAYEDRTGRRAEPPFLTPARVVQLIALALVVAGILVAFLLPGGVSVDGSGRVRSTYLLPQYGPGILVPFLIPLAAAAIPLLAGLWRRTRSHWRLFAVPGALVLTGFAVVASASVGWYFAPAAVAALVAAALPGRPRIAAGDRAVVTAEG